MPNLSRHLLENEIDTQFKENKNKVPIRSQYSDLEYVANTVIIWLAYQRSIILIETTS